MTVAERAAMSFKRNDGNVDWAWVERSVAMSEPPRIEDLPAHAKYVKQFGGGSQ